MVQIIDETIKFSVLIPVYNVEEYLAACLDSVLQQTYTNFEIILTNDGSTDRSGQICEEYASIDDRVFVYHQENKGLLLARRKSISFSSGEFSLFLDSDDSWKTNTLEIIYNTIQSTKADMVIFNWDRLNKKKVLPGKKNFNDKEIELGITKDRIIEKFLRTNELNSLCIKAVKSSLIDKNRDYSHLEGLTMGEDALQSVPLLLKAKKIVYINDSLYNYRVNEDSTTNIFNPSHIKEISIVEKAKINMLRQINRHDLMNDLSKRYVYGLSKQIMLVSITQMNKEEKIIYLKEIQQSDIYVELKKYYKIPELIFPVRFIITELNKENYKNVLKIGKLYSYFWNNFGSLKRWTKGRALN